LKDIQEELSAYDFIYLGDNARAPYGTRSFEVVYQFTRQAVCRLFEMGCHLVILACNTASAKALRTIQQRDLPSIDPQRRVLGVIRPTAECVGEITQSRHIGVLGTTGTINSKSYPMEINKLYPDIIIHSEACPMWVPLVENGESDSSGADYFVKRHLDALMSRDPQIDTLLLGCTHYPLLLHKIRQYTPASVRILTQGMHVARSLKDYLLRHPEMDAKCTRHGTTTYYTTEDAAFFSRPASLFLGKNIVAHHVTLE
jgi:glutamate racemase